MNDIQHSLIIPVYKNSASIKHLCESLATIKASIRQNMEIIFVIDGSPDDSLDKILKYRHICQTTTRIIELSKNEGSLIALKAGIDSARGKYIVTKAADLQEPVALTENMLQILKKGNADIVFGLRKSRKDPFISTMFSNVFWFAYKKLVDDNIPIGGVDVIGFNNKVLPHIKNMKESRSSLIEYLFWLGFSKQFVPYGRLERKEGKSAWTFSKKMNYVIDSTFSFSNLPISILFFIGITSFITALLFGVYVVIGKTTGSIHVPGYAATVLVSLFFFGLNAVGLSILGNYIWRIYENTKQRPPYIIKNNYD